MQDVDIRNECINKYLKLAEDTETPQIMHTWSLLASISACLGRRNYFDFNIELIYPNIYCFLVGPPAVRKSTSIKLLQKMLKKATGIRFTPDDTSGKYQGLITAFEGADEKVDLADGLDKLDAAMLAANLSKLGESKMNAHFCDKYTMAAFASELSTFLGTNSMDMLRCLLKIWDGEDYEYQLKASQAVLKDPLLTLIGATTPVSINRGIPPEAIGEGFMSRVILVFSKEKNNRVVWPKKWQAETVQEFHEFFSYLFYQFEGVFTTQPAAHSLMDKLCQIDFTINDPRFNFYLDRRQAHLIKISMLMAASRLSHEISELDVFNAHNLLRYTELSMPDALGEFGLSPLAMCKQRIVDYISHTPDPIPESALWAVMHRDMRRHDFEMTMAELTNSKKIALVHVGPVGEKMKAYISKAVTDNRVLEDISEFLTEN